MGCKEMHTDMSADMVRMNNYVSLIYIGTSFIQVDCTSWINNFYRIIIIFSLYIAQSHQEAFFSKNLFRLQGRAHETSFATFSLLVEESFMRNVSRIDMLSAADCIDRDSAYGCNAFRQLILSGVRMEYDGQLLTHQGYHSSINVYNSSTTTLQNSGMCSNGTHRYHSFSVKIYFANITGSFRIYLQAQFYIPHNSESATIHGDIFINSGKICKV